MSVVGGQPKKHTNPSYKAAKHIKRTFLIYLQYIVCALRLSNTVICVPHYDLKKHVKHAIAYSDSGYFLSFGVRARFSDRPSFNIHIY